MDNGSAEWVLRTWMENRCVTSGGQYFRAACWSPSCFSWNPLTIEALGSILLPYPEFFRLFFSGCQNSGQINYFYAWISSHSIVLTHCPFTTYTGVGKYCDPIVCRGILVLQYSMHRWIPTVWNTLTRRKHWPSYYCYYSYKYFNIRIRLAWECRTTLSFSEWFTVIHDLRIISSC